MAYDASLPLRRDPTSGFGELSTLKAAVHQDLLILLLTAPGERVMDPLFGVGLKRYLFQPLTRSTLASIEARIKEQVFRYLSFITIESVNFQSALDSGPGATVTDMDPNQVSINITYKFGRGVYGNITVGA